MKANNTHSRLQIQNNENQSISMLVSRLFKIQILLIFFQCCQLGFLFGARHQEGVKFYNGY